MVEENRVFDVARPGRTAPEPTAKPVIVGHHPMQSDPMVKEERDPMDFGTEAQPTKISVMDDNAADKHENSGPDLAVLPELTSKPGPELQSWSMPDPKPKPESEPTPRADSEPTPEPEPPVDTPPMDDPSAPSFETPAEAPRPTEEHATEPAPNGDTQPTPPAADDAPVPEEPAPPMAQVEALHFEPRHRGGRLKWLILGLLVLLVAAYLAIDAGIIASGVKLPFHIFKQKSNPTPAATTTPPASQNTPAPVSNLPAGFKKYNLTGTDISFAAPSSWGTANSASEDGYSSRSTSAKPDSNYAYLVTFSDNKDVQIAVTSGKLLPAARGAQYYDFLQWCTGTNDGKIYKSLLNFTTANGVSTPSTISCDQGPLLDATKLSDNSIVQLKTKDASGAVIGDLYTKNLSETSLPVLRIKDAAMTNGDNIKLMLPTIKPAND
jgi:hypothetical protein